MKEEVPVRVSVLPLSPPLRLDLWIHHLFPQVSRTRLKQVFEDGGVLLNARPALKSARISGKEEITLLPSVARVFYLDHLLPNVDIPLDIVYEDAHLFVLNKPTGIDTIAQSLEDQDTLANAAVAKWPTVTAIGTPFEAGLLQRLDRDTSGLVMGAKTEMAWQAARALMTQGKIEKGYLALVSGNMAADCGNTGVIRFHLASRSKHSRKVSVDPTREGHYITQWKVTSIHGDVSRLEVTITQGFRHQIRAHLAAMGHPIVGDILYGGPLLTDISGHYLHAHRLTFRHPITGQPLVLESPMPLTWHAIVDRE